VNPLLVKLVPHDGMWPMHTGQMLRGMLIYEGLLRPDYITPTITPADLKLDRFGAAEAQREIQDYYENGPVD